MSEWGYVSSWVPGWTGTDRAGLAATMTDCDRDAAPIPNRIASYVPTLRACGDDLRLRVVLHDFGLV